ncbi:MAG: GTP 3',8-cyclase MoaA [Euryarchaeota archaeon]|nr:GTP 3',8-cyclase MoaA [Euryarchaeota archaeon]
MLVDRFERPFSDLRVSLNEACNLSCSYCHLEGGAMTKGDLTAEEFERIGRLAARCGAKYVKITGGEPTLHPEVVDIVRRLAPHFEAVSMTTNGTTLRRLAGLLREAGLARVNVSLDTVDAAAFRALTGGGEVDKVRDGIGAAIEAGLHPVKVNMVVLKGVNDDRITEMEGFCAEVGAALQLIELHTDRGNAFGVPFRGSFHSLADTERALAERAERVEIAPQHHRRRYFVPHQVEVVRPFGNSDFCSACHRIRLTADGKLKPCLMRTDNHVDIIGPMRNGATDEELLELFVQVNDLREPYWPDPVEGEAARRAVDRPEGLPRLRVL